MSTYFCFFQNDLKVILSSWELKLYFSSKLFQSSKSNLSINTVSMHSRFTVSMFAYVKSYRLPRSVQPVRLPSSINILTPLSGFECVVFWGTCHTVWWITYSIPRLRWEAFRVVMCHGPDLVYVPGAVEHSVTGKGNLGCSGVAVAMESCQFLCWKIFFVSMPAELRI